MSFNLDKILRLSKLTDVKIDGGNSFVKKVSYGSAEYCVKNYSQRSDSGARLIREFSALSYLEKFESRTFAKPLGYSLSDSLAVYSWLKGSKPELNKFTVDLMLSIVKELKNISSTSSPLSFDNAKDFIFVDLDVKTQIVSRYRYLVSDTSRIPTFLMKDLEGSMKKLLQNDTLCGRAVVTLSVSDFGPHNLLWDDLDQELHCVDLEFFGWDDCHKLLIDTLLHPQISWNAELVSFFFERFHGLFDLELNRLLKMWQFLSFKWALIMLNRLVNQEKLQFSDQSKEIVYKRIHSYILQSNIQVGSIGDMLEQVTKLDKS
jgi:hypothetical protein